jgi:hypothetical protein
MKKSKLVLLTLLPAMVATFSACSTQPETAYAQSERDDDDKRHYYGGGYFMNGLFYRNGVRSTPPSGYKTSSAYKSSISRSSRSGYSSGYSSSSSSSSVSRGGFGRSSSSAS